MAQSREERLYWRDDEWLNEFFDDFANELHHCSANRLEPNIQNTDEYNDTRQRCQFILDYYLTRLERIVTEMENTETPREIVENIIHHLQDIVTHNIFEGIVDQTTERVIHEDFNELQITNPMLQGNNQEWSELSLVNHFNRLYGYYMRVIQYINRQHNTDNVGGRKRKKYKSIKTNKSKKAKKKTKRVKKQKSRKLKK